jgi:hypothetical protein
VRSSPVKFGCPGFCPGSPQIVALPLIASHGTDLLFVNLVVWFSSR